MTNARPVDDDFLGSFSSASELERQFPAAHRSGMTATVTDGTTEHPYTCDGSTWKPVALYATDPLTGNVTGLVGPSGVMPLLNLLSQSGIPIGIPPSGAVGANGALTLGTATPIIYSAGIYMYFASAKLYPASPAGFYWTVMSSTTAGIVYNNVYSPGTNFPQIPAAPTAIVATGPGAYTGVQTEVTAVSVTIPGGMLGKNGRLNFEFMGGHNNTAGNKTYGLYIGGALMSNLTATTSVTMVAPAITITNRGAENKQVAANSIISGTGSAAPATASIDTTVDVIAEIRLTHSTSATDLLALESHRITVSPRGI